ncbi:MAG: response regulator [Planctomycetes bacterium]|nr:response regulator [Planctomycetota bacterium]
MKTILLADDEANLRNLVRTTLDDPSYRILEACDGIAALEIARRERPDLFVLDWMMPRMNGIDVAKALLSESLAPVGRIIMLTARGQEKDREAASTLGIVNYLTKPFSPRELLAKVDALLDGVVANE